MNDKEYAKQRARVTKILNSWQKTLGLSWYKLTVAFERDYKHDDEDTALFGVVGDCKTLWQYRSAHITFYLPAVADQEDEELETQVVHELTHVLLGSIQNLDDDEHREKTEYATETVARALIWTREQGRSEYRPRHRRNTDKVSK